MKEFFSNMLTGVGFTDVIDILLVAFVVYKVLGFIRESRAEQLVKGLLLLVVCTVLSGWFHLYTLNWLLKAAMALGALALVIVFQPELRRGLEHMGRGRFIKMPFVREDKERAKVMVSEFVKAIDEMSAKKEGALIVIERETSLSDIVESGTIINSDINAELIENIFYEGAPLHDGAMIVRGNQLHAAGCVLPLTENKSLSSELGTRHRAGIGITEKSDAVTFIVSEETGIISYARDGKLERYLDDKTVEKILMEIYLVEGNMSSFKETKERFDKKIRREK